MSVSIDQQIGESKKAIDGFLDQYLKNQIHRAEKLDPSYSELWKSIYKLFDSGGKRFRPIMSLLSYQALGGNHASQIISTVSSQELLHLSLLIHDDIIDRDYIRYGVKNISGQYQDKYKKYLSHESEILHYSNSAAILAGDLLISSSYQLLLQDANDNHIKQLVSVFDDAIFYVAGGELIDTESAFIIDNKSLIINELKTAHYSFVAPLIIGAILADSSDEIKKLIIQLGILVGTAYQLVDDSLGIFGDDKLTGKSTSSDVSEGKRTFMIEQFYKLASKDQITKFDKLFGKANISTAELEEIRSLLIDSGAHKSNLEKINNLKSQAEEIIKQIPIEDSSKNIFYELVKLTLNRIK